MQTYRVAILGCRSRGTAAARAYHAHPRTEVVALCDLLQERLDTLGDELGVSARFTDLDAMMQDHAPDIVAIPTGTEFHHDLAMRVLEYGAHIDVEKPLCIDLVQADAVLAKAASKGARVAVHHQGRTGASMHAIAKAYQAGRIGKLLYVLGSGKGYYGGYGLMNIGTHTLNNILKITGHCQSVSAIASTNGLPITPENVVPSPGGMGTIAGESITASLEFEDAVTGTLMQHRFPRVDSTAYRFELFGTEGRLIWKSGGPWLLPQPHFLPDGNHDRWEPLELIMPEGFDPICGAGLDEYWFVHDYVEALDTGRDHDCSGAEARHVLEIMMGIFESAAYRRRVELPQEQRDHPLLRWRREQGQPVPEPMPRGYGEWLAKEDERNAGSRA